MTRKHSTKSMDAQRSKALVAAHDAKQQLARLRAAIREGELDYASLLLGTDAEWEQTLSRMKVRAFLRSIPGIGEGRTENVLAKYQLRGSTRVGDLPDDYRKGIASDVRGTLDVA